MSKRKYRPWVKRHTSEQPYKYRRFFGSWKTPIVLPGPMAPRRATANAKASTALKMIRKLKKEQEIKNVSSMAGTMQIPNTGDWICEGFGPYVSQGTTRATRIGNKITLKSLAMRFQIQETIKETDGAQVRIVLYYDRRPAGALLDVGACMYTDDNIMSLYTTDEDYVGRFQILMDKIINIPNSKKAAYGKFFTTYPFKVVYNGNAGDITDLVKGSFCIGAMAMDPANAIDVNYGYKFTFTDD